MNRNLNRRIHPIAEADGMNPKKLVILHYVEERIILPSGNNIQV